MVKYLDGVLQTEITNLPATQIVSGTVTSQLKVGANSSYTTSIPTATPYTMAAVDGGSPPAFKTFRVAALYDQATQIDFYCGSSSTLTSNKIYQTVQVAANTPTTIDFPISARYFGVKVTNKGTATTTVNNLQYIGFSN